MTTIRYKGFKILAKPYRLSESRHWTVDLEIHRHGRGQAFSAGERYPTVQEAEAQCSELGRSIIDGGVPGRSVDRLRSPRGVQALLHFWKAGSMRRLVIVLLVILGVGFGLARGANFASRADVPSESRVEKVMNQQQLIPPWLIGTVMLVGVALLVAGSWKRARRSPSKGPGHLDWGTQ